MAVNMEGASPPVFEQIFRNARFAQGGNALFEGKVKGNPKPQVVWTRKGLQMKGNEKHQMIYDENSGKVSLMIKAIGPGDEGEYTCTALNPYGEAICTVYISPEATKQVKKSRSGHKLHKSNSNKQVQLVQQQQQQQQQQLQMQQQFSQQQQFSSSQSQQTSQQTSVQQQQSSSVQQFSQQSSSMQHASMAQESSSMSSSTMQVKQQSSSSSFQQSTQQQQRTIKESEPEVIYLKHVERQQQQQKREDEVSTKYASPSFLTPLRDLTINEGEKAHFDAKVGPVGDPSMKVEWFFSGQLITASSRINSTCQFGFVALDMLNSSTNDSGEYTCVVKNDAGTTQSSCRLTVQARKELDAEFQHSQSLRQVEIQQQQQKTITIQEEVMPQKPEFVKPLTDLGEKPEGSNVHLEAQVNPVSDHTMQIEWFKDGRPITASSRIGQLFSFGYVSLNINGLRAEDAGTYTCRATNAAGEAITQATIEVSVSQEMSASTGIAEQQQYIQKVQQLEQHQATKQMTRMDSVTVESTQPPEFKSPILDQLEIREGGFAHFEARLEPMGDASMKVEWLKDGHAVDASSRITSFFNFGYVALTIKQVAIHDAGTYSCVAYNKCGKAETSAKLTTTSRQEGDFQSKQWSSIQQMEMKKEVVSTSIQQEVTMAPKFVSNLKGTNVVLEGQRAHFECRLEPQNDPKLTVQWLFNGQTLAASSRIQTNHDFGYVAIDILEAKKEDSGKYTLVASNALGSQEASVNLRVDAHMQGVDTTTIHAKTVEETKRFEMKQEMKVEVQEAVMSTAPPVFIMPLQDPPKVSEGQNIHFEAKLEPVGDPNMKVEWFFNGRPLTIGSRFRTYNDFGFVALDIVGVIAQDMGQYVCRATNQLGQADTSAKVDVHVQSNIVTESEHEVAMQQISYLESSQQITQQVVEQEVKQPPQFVKTLKNVEAMEGQNVHLEARLLPTGDSTMNIEWTLNGKPLKTGHKFKPAYDFDYVALDLLTIYPEDSGIYTCHARNAYGEAQTASTVKVQGSGQIVSESRSEMNKFEYLEQKQVIKQEITDDQTSQAPVFTSSMKSVEIKEGQRAHFECRIIPVSDPTLKVEWLHNGAPIKQGSRFKEGLDFGFVSLDIMQCLPEDAGSYTCRATNRLGQAINSADLIVQAKQTIVKDTIHQAAVEQINYLEKSRVTQTQDEGFTTQAPAFTCSMRDMQIMEGSPAHFEAKLVPVGDPKLRVDWLKDGKPIQASNRMSTLHDFGFVAFDLKYTRPDDAGTYSCRAINALGEANISANLKVISSKTGPYGESLHGDALEKIAYLEKKQASHGLIEEEGVGSAPIFVVPLQGKTSLIEGQNVHMECRIEPYPDSSLKVEWFHNDKPLPFGNRWRTSYDFGFAALDILGSYPEDSGKYTLKATNILGTSESSIDVKVASRSGLLLDSEHSDALEKIRYLESKHQRTAEEEMAVSEAPQFGHQLKDVTLDEAQPAHFETTLTPVNDATMKVEWFCNGQPVPQGHRFRTTYDFGFVALDILYAYPEDCGTYTCRATNMIGETTTSCALTVQGKSGLLLDTMDRDRLTQLKNLESRSRAAPVEGETELMKPVFTTALNNAEGVTEQGRVHLECRLEPINDPNLKVEWFMNGKSIQTGHRFKTRNDFGFVALDILYAYPEDSGTYMCKATNKLGEAVNTCSVEVVGKTGLCLDSQHPEGWEKVKSLEARGGRGRLEVEDMPVGAPHFVTELMGNTTMSEGQIAHFEAQIEPIHDPDLKIEFIHNGKPIKQGSRFHTLCDFGYVALDIGQLVSEDSGEYTCRVYNKHGEATSFITLNVSAKGTLDTSSQRPEGLEKIKQLESRQHALAQEELRTFQKPVFTQALQNVEKEENQNARFAARLIPVGDTTLNVKWFKNGQVLETGSRINMVHDFGCVSLDITGLRASDEGIYECKASNSLGEAVTTAECKVAAKGSLLLDSHHPEGMKKIAALETAKSNKANLADQDQEFDKPVFVSPLTGTADVADGGQAHMECRVAPVGDTNMKFQWFCNGEALKMGSRFQVTQDFGFVTLDIAACVPEDSGMYMVKATNLIGDASSSFALHVGGKGGIQQPPVFMEQLGDIGAVAEGSNVHAEARIEPKNDPNLKVEWELNGKSISSGSRLKTTLEFGHVQLNINGVRSSDSGIYTCKAINALGEAVSTTSIKVEGTGVDSTDAASGPPKFVTKFSSSYEVQEMQGCHLEAKLTPAEDPHMNVQWFKDGKPLATGHRFRTFNDFGIVILDVLYCYAEDSGTYECKASNKQGSDSISCTITCSEKSSLILTPQVPGEMKDHTMQRIQHLESMKMSRTTQSTLTQGVAPRFTVPISNIEDLKEGENAHFEARLIPTDDPTLTIDWYWNGKALKAGSRIRTFCDFGFVILEISPVYPEDSGEYLCKAKNALGEAVTTATLKCGGKRNIIMDSQLPKGMEGAIDKIANLEGLGRIRNLDPSEVDTNQPPEFLSNLEDLLLPENALAHFETRLTPVNDPSMRVEWYHNGKQLSAGSRIKTINDFGFVILEVANVLTRDSGNYTCKAANRHGECSISCNVEVKTKKSIITDPQLPKSFRSGTDSINRLEENRWRREEMITEEFEGTAPKFISQIHDVNVIEGQPAHFDCRVEPIGDGSMQIEWYHEDKPIQIGSRLHTISDFGFVVLDIDWTFKRDSGVYTCRASNKNGSAETKAVLTCKSRKDVNVDSQLPQGMSLEKLKDLERGRAGSNIEDEVEITAPKFITQIESRAVGEGEPVHFNCRVEPKHDPKLLVKWYHNEKELASGHRFRITHEFGYVALDILYVYPEDEGEYVCKASNELGEDITKCTLRCKELPAIQLENQVPKGMKKSEQLVQMEAAMKKYSQAMFLTEDDVYDAEKRQPPRFVTQIQSVTTLVEMQATKFECQLAPVGDPNMKVEWFFNGKALPFKNRFTPIYDFGYVAMNFGWVYPEDSGEYVCRATNLYGMDETRGIIKTSGKPGIIYESQLPRGMESIEKIRKLESGWDRASELIEVENERFKPCFVTKPEEQTACEGDTARFCCRVTGYPKPRVMWLLNGHTVINGSKHKLVYDGMWHFDIPKCRDIDAGKVEVIARNSCGEAYSTTTLTVTPRQDDYRSVLRHNVKRDYMNSKEYRKPEWVTRMEEIQKRLAEQAQSAKFTNELREARVHEGTKVKFEATYAGNPRPEFTWQFNGKELPTSDNYRIKVRDNSVCLTIYETTMAMTGHYTCIAKNDLGTDTTRAGLTIKKALSAEEKARLEELAEAEKNKLLQKKKAAEDKKKKLEELAQQQKEQQLKQQEERKAARLTKPKPQPQKEKEAPKEEQKFLKKRPEQKKPEPKSEEPKELPKLKKVEQIKAASPVRRSQSPELRDNLRRVEQPKRAESPARRPESPVTKLKPTPKKAPEKEEKEPKKEPELKPSLKKPKPSAEVKDEKKVKKAPPQKSAPPPSIPKEDKVEKKPIVELKAKQVTIDEKAKETVQVSDEDFAGPMKELADITVRLEHGATVEEVNSAYEAHEFPKLERKTSQMAMLSVIERIGESATVKQVVSQECTSKAEPDEQAKSLDNIGFTALLTTLSTTSHKAEEVITSFQPEDFTERASQQQFAKLIHETPELMEVAQATEQSTEITEEVDSGVKIAVVSEVKPESVAAAAKQPEAQQVVSQVQPEAPQAVLDTSGIKEGDVFFALATFVSETGEAMNLVEGEKVHVLEWNNTDWWYVRKHLTEESGWVPAQYLKDELTYTMYVQKKLVEKIEKLPVFDKPKEGEASFAPKITEKVRSMAASDGSQVEFVCKVEGSPRPQITWFRQTAIIKPSQDFQIFYYDDNKATLVIKEVFPEDAGTFTCVAKNCVGYASSSAELMVEHPLSEHMGLEKHDRRSLSRESSLADIVEGIPPTFAQRPQTKAADEGSATELECRFVAIPEAEVQWFHNKVELKEEVDRVSIIHQADMHMYCSIIRISNVKKEDEGTYEVCAKNREGEANNTLVLNVKAKDVKPKKVEVKELAPMIVKPLTPTLCKVGDSVKIETVITGKPKPALEWSFNGLPLVTLKKTLYNVRLLEKDEIYTLIIDNVKQVHDGEYTIRAKNSSGCVQTSANISVQADKVVEFVKPLEDVEIKEKDVIEIDVELSTDEVANVKWYKDGEVIDPKDDTKYAVKSVGRKHSLKIINATVHHEGEYTAAVGEQECSCELTVVELPPEFTKKIEPVKATVGEEKAVFEIELSKGDAITKWFKNGTEVELSERVQSKIDGKKQRLEISNVSTTDAGEYSCTIGKEKCTAGLAVEEPKVNFEAKLPETTTASVGQEVQITVQLSSETEAVQWLKDGKPLEAQPEKYAVKKEGRKQSIVIKDAKIEDVAEYTCVAENVKTKTELELKGSEEKIEAVEPEVKEQIATKGQDMTYKVEFKKELHRKPTVQWMFGKKEVNTSERIITNTYRTYTIITIKQVEDSDIGPYVAKISNSVSEVNAGFNLCIKDKPAPPKGPASQEWMTKDSKRLQWNAPANDGGAKITEYIVERREVGKKSWKQVGTSQAETTSIEIKGLKQDTSYDFRVAAKNSVGLSLPTIIEETATSKTTSIAQSQSQVALATSQSSTTVAAKPKSAPSAPRDVQVKVVTSLSVTLQWIPPANNGGAELTGYIIEKRLATSHTWEKAATVETSVTEYTVENLKEKCAYYFRVSAENEVGTGEAAATEKASLKTSAKAPSAPTAPLEISCLTPHSIMVEWGAPDSDGGAPLEGYKVAVRDAKRQMWMEVGRVEADVQRLQVKDLAEGKDYFIRIFAKNEVGFSDPLENEEPFKVVRPAGYTGEDEKEDAKHDETPSLSFTTETMSSWMRDANMDANIQSYTKSSVLRRDEYFFRIWYYANKLFKE